MTDHKMQKYIVTSMFKMISLRWPSLGFGKGKMHLFDFCISSRASRRNKNKKLIASWVCQELSSVKGSYRGKVQPLGHRIAAISTQEQMLALDKRLEMLMRTAGCRSREESRAALDEVI